MHKLEVPGGKESPDWASLYLYRGEEVNVNRPIFTGDVFNLPEESRKVIVVQHPCAIRQNGVDLAEKLLVCEVEKSHPVKPNGWNGNYKQMPLPELDPEDAQHHSAFFHHPDVVESVTLDRENRVACLSHSGVNILLQRWIHHNSRVIVPTFNIADATGEQLEEADLVEEWCDERSLVNPSVSELESEAHRWLRSDSGNGKAWQQLLESPQDRSRVRAAMRRVLRS